MGIQPGGQPLETRYFRPYHFGNLIPFFPIRSVRLASLTLASNPALGHQKTPPGWELEGKDLKGPLCIKDDPEIGGPSLSLS